MYGVSMFPRRASFFLCIGVSMFPRCAPFLMLGVLMFHRCAPFSLRASGSRTHYVRVFLNHIRSHRGYCTLCDAYVFWPGGVKSRLEIQHLNRRQRCLFSLVPMLAAGAVFGLLDVVGGGHAEDHRFARDQVCLGDAVGYGLADIIEVRCLALDHTSEANDGVDISFARHEQAPE